MNGVIIPPSGESGGGRVYSFNVTDLDVNIQWGSGYYASKIFTIPESITNKKIFVTFVSTTSASASLMVMLNSSTQINVSFVRQTNSTISGKLHVMVAD